MNQIIISFSQLVDLLTSIIIGWVILICVFFFCMYITHLWNHKKQQHRLKMQATHKEQIKLDELNRSIQEMLKGQALYFFRESQKITDLKGNPLPELSGYCCRLAPFADNETLPDKAIEVLFAHTRFSKDGNVILLFGPNTSDCIYCKVEKFAAEDKVVLSHPIMGSIYLHNTEKQAEHIGQTIRICQLTRFKDGVYSSFCQIPSRLN